MSEANTKITHIIYPSISYIFQKGETKNLTIDFQRFATKTVSRQQNKS